MLLKNIHHQLILSYFTDFLLFDGSILSQIVLKLYCFQSTSASSDTKKLFNNQKFLKLQIISSILIISLFDSRVKLLVEIKC